jgi:hypothetical protein
LRILNRLEVGVFARAVKLEITLYNKCKKNKKYVRNATFKHVRPQQKPALSVLKTTPDEL